MIFLNLKIEILFLDDFLLKMSETYVQPAILSDVEIKKELEVGNIIISPFSREQLSNCSYDVTLGEYYYRCTNQLEYFNPWQQDHVDKYWGEYLQAKPLTQEEREKMKIDDSIGINDKVILINPGETILGHTNEFIGGRNFITTMMKSRSSLGRVGINFCKCSGWGDNNYYNIWTMEITNFSNSTVLLPVNRRIAQIVFLYTGKCENPYKSKYQTEPLPLEELKNKWHPTMMLPKLHLDYELKLNKNN